MRPLIKETVMNEWAELDSSFVGNVVGGEQEQSRAAPSSKL